MTNQKYIEEIIKVAQQGDYEVERYYFDENGNWDYEPVEVMLMKPTFWRAIGKVKMWEEELLETSYTFWSKEDETRVTLLDRWENNMHTFLDKIIEKDLDHAIEWLYNLIKE